MLKNKSDDGREVCYAYQKDSCKGACGRVHICQFCGGRHPLSWHTKPSGAPGGGDAAGSRANLR